MRAAGSAPAARLPTNVAADAVPRHGRILDGFPHLFSSFNSQRRTTKRNAGWHRNGQDGYRD